MDFTDINKNLVDSGNMPGVAQLVYFGLHADVATWPTPPSGPADLEAAASLVGSIAMSAGKKMFKLYSTDEAVSLQINPAGETESKFFEVVLNIFHPGLQNKILGFMNATKNANMIFIVKDNHGKMFLLGDSLRSVKFTGGENIGPGTNEKRGVGMQFTYKTPAVYSYEGDIPLTPAASGSS